MDKFENALPFDFVTPIAEHFLSMWIDIENFPQWVEERQNFGRVLDNRTIASQRPERILIQVLVRLGHRIWPSFQRVSSTARVAMSRFSMSIVPPTLAKLPVALAFMVPCARSTINGRARR